MAVTNTIGVQAITPSDTTTFSPPMKRLWAGVAGNLTLIDSNGNTVAFTAFPIGQWVSFHTSGVSAVKATGTTSTNVIGDTNPE